MVIYSGFAQTMDLLKHLKPLLCYVNPILSKLRPDQSILL